MEYKPYKIVEIGKDFGDAPFGSALKSVDYTESGVPVIQGRNIKNNKFEWNHKLYVSEEKFESIPRSHCREGDLVFPKIGTIGVVAIVPKVEDNETFLLSTNMMKMSVDEKLADLHYVYYYFCQESIREKIRAQAGGSSQPIFNFTTLKKFEIKLPSLVIQKRIAEILSAYDDLIENNLKRIRLLEESARLLYREWFVRLKFPNHEHTPLIAGLPEGWKRKELQEVCKEIRQSVSPEQMEINTPYIGLEHIPRRSITLSEWSDTSEIQSMKHKFIEGDILFGKIRPYFHKVGVAFIDGVASSDAIVIRPNDENLHGLVLMTVSSELFVAHATASSYGAKMPRADWKVLQKFIVAVPPENVLKEFANFINPIVKKLKVLVLQNQKLKQARDLLLPRLMSGEIAV